MRRVSCFIFLLTFAAACASQSDTPAEESLPVADLDRFLTDSCPEGQPYILPEKISVVSEDIGWNISTPEKDNGLSFDSVFKLTSPSARFGGLSGLDFLDNDTLLMVSDMGEFIWLDVDPLTAGPASSGYIALLKDERGQPFSGKRNRDSEGVAWNGQYAFVSFERDHRILGYDLEGCGGNARGIPVVAFDEQDFDFRQKVNENQGLEALADFGDGLITGLETNILKEGAAPFTVIERDKNISFSGRLQTPEITRLVGFDVTHDASGAPVSIYALTRSYDPIRGNRLSLLRADVSSARSLGQFERLAVFGKPLTVDNFEGIAVRSGQDGADQIFLISDDNFSSKQNTLLAVLSFKASN